LVSRYLVGKDGRTGYERRKGRRCKLAVVPFAEVVWYRAVRKGKQQKEKGETEMREGIWLGHADQTNEILIGTEQGVIRVYDVKRKEEGARWDAEKIKKMKGTPRQPDPEKPGGDIPVRVSFEKMDEQQDVPEVAPMRKGIDVRRFRINPEMLKKHGYTVGCEGCKFQQSGLKDAFGRGRPHKEECRKRLMEELSKSKEGKAFLEREEERINQKIAMEVEKKDQMKANNEISSKTGVNKSGALAPRRPGQE